jgi:hypothetical protein
LLGVLVAACALAAYVYTAAPEPGWIDSGELAVVSHTLGIAHPTAKPVYVLLSRVFVILLPGPFFPLTFLSAVLAAGALFLIAQTARQLIGTGSSWTAVLAPLILAVSPLVWEQATINEVHALQLFFVSAALYVWTRGDLPNRLFFLVYVLSLALATHGTAIFLAPLVLASLWSQRRRARTWIGAVAVALTGLTVYLVLPVRSARYPLMDWDHTAAWAGFWRHVTGWQYSIFTATFDLQSLSRALSSLASLLWANLPGVILPLCALGLWSLWSRRRTDFWVTLITTSSCVAFSLTYAIPDIAPYYLVAFALLALWAAAGTAWLGSLRRWYGSAAAAAMVLSLAFAVAHHFEQLNQRTFRVPTDWVRDALETVEPRSVVLSREWDHYSPWLYLRFVEGLRPDVTWIDTELLRRSWYPEFIRQADPERYAQAKPALDRLAPHVARFEAGQTYDPATIETAYGDAIYALSLGQPGAVYVDPDLGTDPPWASERAYLRGAQDVPWGLLSRNFRPDEEIPPLPDWPAYRNARASPAPSLRTEFHLGLYTLARKARTAYIRARNP